MLHSVQQFAQDQDPALAQLAAVRHGQHFAELEQPLPELTAELPNLVVACRRAIARKDSSVAAKTFSSVAQLLGLELAREIEEQTGA
jgi:hypothetical protein